MVDATLAHGRAKFLCDQLHARIVAAGREPRRAPRKVPSEKKAAVVLDAYGRHWRTLELASWRIETTARAWWVFDTDGRTHIDVLSLALAYAREARHDYRASTISARRLRLDVHAIARILQRQSRLDFPALHDELETTVFALAPLYAAAKQLGHRRFALPTPNGLLVGDVGAHHLVARSWYARLLGEYAELREAFSPWVTSTPPNDAASARLTIAPPDHAPAGLLFEQFRTVLTAFPKLKEPFVPGTDPHTSVWAHAPSRLGHAASSPSDTP